MRAVQLRAYDREPKSTPAVFSKCVGSCSEAQRLGYGLRIIKLVAEAHFFCPLRPLYELL
jgi:hypothetical protein